MTDMSKSYICLENKSNLKINGVDEVLNLTESEVCVIVCGEILEIKGTNLKAEKLSVECGELVINGSITALTFKTKSDKKGFFKRLFK